MRNARLIRKQRFARVTNLVGSLRIADATKDTLKSLRHLFSQSNGVSEEVLLDYYGPAAPPNHDNSAVCVFLDALRACLAAAPPLSSPHKDSWHVQHLSSLTTDLACGEALASLMTTLVKGDVSERKKERKWLHHPLTCAQRDACTRGCAFGLAFWGTMSPSPL